MKESLNIRISNVKYSKDKVSRKYVQTTYDNFRIETLYVDYKNKHIICFSTQIGCNLKCKFCYNGLKHNFKRNLTSEEICNQIENVIKEENINNDKPILFSAMGIGEPLLNYDNLIKDFESNLTETKNKILQENRNSFQEYQQKIQSVAQDEKSFNALLDSLLFKSEK